MNPAPKGQRKFVCKSCQMSITFPPEHPMTNKLVGSYQIGHEWVCSKTCFDQAFDPQSLTSK
jgi:hypothetical protein